MNKHYQNEISPTTSHVFPFTTLCQSMYDVARPLAYATNAPNSIIAYRVNRYFFISRFLLNKFQ